MYAIPIQIEYYSIEVKQAEDFEICQFNDKLQFHFISHTSSV